MGRLLPLPQPSSLFVSTTPPSPMAPPSSNPPASRRMQSLLKLAAQPLIVSFCSCLPYLVRMADGDDTNVDVVSRSAFLDRDSHAYVRHVTPSDATWRHLTPTCWRQIDANLTSVFFAATEYIGYSIKSRILQVWSVVPDHFWSRAHVITYRISKNESQNTFSTAMESSASSLSCGFLTLAQGLSSLGFLRPFWKGRLPTYIYISYFWCKNWITIVAIRAVRGQFLSYKVVQGLPRQPLIPSINGWNWRVDYIGLRWSNSPPTLIWFWCIIIIIAYMILHR